MTTDSLDKKVLTFYRHKNSKYKTDALRIPDVRAAVLKLKDEVKERNWWVEDTLFNMINKIFGTLANADGIEDKSKPSGRSGK